MGVGADKCRLAGTILYVYFFTACRLSVVTVLVRLCVSQPLWCEATALNECLKKTVNLRRVYNLCAFHSRDPFGKWAPKLLVVAKGKCQSGVDIRQLLILLELVWTRSERRLGGQENQGFSQNFIDVTLRKTTALQKAFLG